MFIPLPYGVDRKMTRIPYAIYGLAVVNVLVYLVCVGMGWELFRRFVEWGGVIPGDIRWHALLTMNFIHDAPLPFHIGGNMLFLVLFGRHVEDAVGWVWTVVLYGVGGLAAAMMQVTAVLLLLPGDADLPMIGASGAVAALMGAFAVRFYRTPVKVFWMAGLGLFLNRAGVVKVSSIIVLGLWGAWELVGGIWEIGVPSAEEGGVAHWAHLGGLAFGALVALAAGMHRHGKEVYTTTDAYNFFRNGEMKRSADCLFELIREHPTDADMHFKLAVALDHTQRPARALAHFAKAVELYAGTGDVAEAARIMRKVDGQEWVARHLDPDVLLKLGDFHDNQQRPIEACRLFAALAQGQPGKPQAERAALNCARVLTEELDRPEPARQWYERVADRGRVPELVAEARAHLDAGHETP